MIEIFGLTIVAFIVLNFGREARREKKRIFFLFKIHDYFLLPEHGCPKYYKTHF